VPRGILSVGPGGHRAVLDEHFGDWWARAGGRCLIAGMAGSRDGWVEAAYRPCPCALDDLAAHLTWVEADRMAIVPGLRCDRAGIPDVLRGEESQVLGALQLLGLDSARLVLPGTHSKWVQVQGGRVQGFETWMTGEFFALLREHSILARTLPATHDTFDPGAFDAGVAHARLGSSVLQTAFGVRTLALFERLAPPLRLSYLSGVVIGEELRSAPTGGGSPVVVVGAPVLTQRYQRALAHTGVDSVCVGEEATWQGLSAIARAVWP
jgi:2-dehydro-3-deoxygalactonokinase